MRFQRNSGRHHFGSGIALAGYSSQSGKGHMDMVPSKKKDKNKRYAFFSNEFLRDQKKNYRFSFF